MHRILWLGLFLPIPALAQSAAPATPQSRYTDLVGKTCRFISEDKETGEDALKRCPGHGDIQVETFASHTRVSLSFRFSRKQWAQNVVTGWSLGKNIEWRGIVANKGFEPYAAIVRVLMKDPEGPNRQADGEVLAVMRIDLREAQACVLGYVDASANLSPNKLARDTADRLAPTFLCGSDAASVAGTKSPWTAELMRQK